MTGDGHDPYLLSVAAEVLANARAPQHALGSLAGLSQDEKLALLPALIHVLADLHMHMPHALGNILDSLNRHYGRAFLDAYPDPDETSRRDIFDS